MNLAMEVDDSKAKTDPKLTFSIESLLADKFDGAKTDFSPSASGECSKQNESQCDSDDSSQCSEQVDVETSGVDAEYEEKRIDYQQSGKTTYRMLKAEFTQPKIYKNGLVWCPRQNKRIAPLSFLHGCRKRRLKD
jgi:hypothetical protein